MMNKIMTDSNPDSRDDVVTMKGGGGGNTKTQQHETTSSSTWGTWEELLLACAVKRHGFKDWDSVAMEIQAKTSLPHLLTTAYNCKLKYHDLRRRFTSSLNDDVVADHDPIPWLDDLRELRVAQLRQELHRYDVSIPSLQLKVKRLEEERGESLKDGEDGETKPDLEEDSKGKGHRSENDKKPHHDEQPDRSEPDDKPDPPLQQPDHENQSVNGSNSTCSKSQDNNKTGREGDRVVSEPDPVPTGSVEPEKGPGGNLESESESDSDKGSSETVAKKRKGAAAAASSGEMRERESSEAQSSASLTRKRNRKRRRRMELPSDEVLLKSQPLVAVLQLIRAHEHSSLFERRLPSQESERYKSMVQQHVDLETIQTKLNKDSYSSCTLTFYRDLLLLFSNAVVFFPKSSVESLTAHQLRRLVLNEMKKNSLITRPDPSLEPSDSLPRPASPSCPTQPPPKRPHELERSDSLLAKHKSTAPIIVCRKRSSISSKPKGTEQQQQQQQQQKDEKKPAFDLKPPDNVAEERGGSVLKSAAKANKESNTVTGTRSSRRTTTTHHENVTNNGSTSSKKQGSKGASEAPKADKKTKTTTDREAAALDKKRSAAADFLKRIKRNSAVDTLKSGGGTSTRGGEQKRRGSTGKVEHKVKERVLRQNGDRKQVNNKEESSPSKRSVGRPPKKAAAAAEANGVSPKRTRESGGKEASRRPRKRSRR